MAEYKRVQDNPYYSPDVIQSVPMSGFRVKAYFDDGAIRVYDVKKLIQDGGVFAPLADEKIFRSTITVLNRTVAWSLDGKFDGSTCVDLAPDVIYHDGEVVTE